MRDLTTLASVKAYLGLATSAQDALLSALISRESRAIEVWTGRQFPAVTMTAHKLNGTGSDRMMLPETPIIDVQSLKIDGVDVPLSADGQQSGYTFDDALLYLVGGDKFPAGRQNVECSWTAGYQTSETALIPAGNTPSLTPSTGGRPVTNLGVSYDGGATLSEVVANVAAGQYLFSAGTYTFAAADSGRRVTMAYQYVPGPIEQACIDMVCQDIKYRDNIGIKSKSIGGETITFSSDGVSTGVQQTLKMYRKFAPV